MIEVKSLDELGYVSRGRSRHRPRDASHLFQRAVEDKATVPLLPS